MSDENLKMIEDSISCLAKNKTGERILLII